MNIPGNLNKKEEIRAHLGIGKGDPGYTPQRGIDYWTEEDKEEIISDVDAALEPKLKLKADKTYVDKRDEDTANATYTKVTNEINPKISQMTVNIATKASISYVDQETAKLDRKKADKDDITDIRASLANKADYGYVDAADQILDTRIDEVEAIAKGKGQGYVFDTEAEMYAWLETHATDLTVGSALYIREVDVPDYWWDGSKACVLETQKVDLSEYATKEYSDECDELIYKSINDLGAEVDVKLAGKANTTDLDDKADKDDIPTDVSELTNDIGYLTAVDIAGKQDTLVSGANIRTINGVSILGEGDMEIEAGGEDEEARAKIAALTEVVDGLNTVVVKTDDDDSFVALEKEDIEKLQGKLIAGENITIAEDGVTISAAGGSTVTMTDNTAGGVNLTVDSAKRILATESELKNLNRTFDNRVTNLTTVVFDNLDEKQEKLIAGTGITIAEDGVTISAAAEYINSLIDAKLSDIEPLVDDLLEVL